MIQAEVAGFDFGQALKAIADIFTALSKPTNSSRDKRRNIKQGQRSMKKLYKWLKKDGWTEPEKVLWEETVANFAEKIKTL